MRVPRVASSSSVGINMTPLIDVVFQLLIFFLVSSHLSRQEAQMALPLPVADTGQDADVRDARLRLTLNVLADGSLVLAGRHVTVDELPERLRQAVLDAGAVVELRIRADRSVPYRSVEPLLTACARAGLSDVAFAVYSSREVAAP